MLRRQSIRPVMSALLSPLVLAMGCAGQSADAPTPDTPTDTTPEVGEAPSADSDTARLDDDPCDAAGYQAMLGAAIAAVTLPASLDHRVIGPDTIVTQDFVATRLNFYTNKDGVITRIACG